MGARITKDAGSMSAMRFRMIEANRAFFGWTSIFTKKTNKGLVDERNRKDTGKWCAVVYSSLLSRMELEQRGG